MDRYNKTLKDSQIGSTVYAVPSESPDDYYVVSTFGDRFDILALEYYKDAKYWWIIAAANPYIRRDSLSIQEGQQIRIPANLPQVLRYFENNNLSR